MDPLTHPAVRKWLSYGTGAGLVVGRRDLEAMVVSVRPFGVRILAETRIESFRERPAAEWGAEYVRFLASVNAKHLAAFALLPADEVILRTIQLPGVTDEHAADAIRFQLDSLHPYEEDSAIADWRRIGSSSSFVVAVIAKPVLDRYTELFAEAGVKLAGITVSGAALREAARIHHQPPPEGFVGVYGLDAGVAAPLEVYGESPARPFFSAGFEMTVEQAAGLAANELRLDPGALPADLLAILPAPSGAPPDFDFSPAARSLGALRYAAALTAACPHLGSPVNLLPPELRAATSRARYVPTVVLSAVLAATGIALAFQGSYEDRRYYSQLQAEIRKLEPEAKRLEVADRETQILLARISQLDDFRLRSKEDLDAMLELTRLIPPPAWITSLTINRTTIGVGGEADQAEALLKTLDASPLFESSEMAMPISKMGAVEQFRIRTQRQRGGRK
jgi:Tfp pilus assembly protein PilN